MGRIILHEQVMVNANFGPAGMTPRAFRLTGQTTRRIESIHHQWRGQHGVETLHYFAVTAGGRPYTLCFHSRDATWLVEEVSP
jgi:hypothetical protein